MFTDTVIVPARAVSADAQKTDALMDEPTFEWIGVEVRPFARLAGFDQQLIGAGAQRDPAAVQTAEQAPPVPVCPDRLGWPGPPGVDGGSGQTAPFAAGRHRPCLLGADLYGRSSRSRTIRVVRRKRRPRFELADEFLPHDRAQHREQSDSDRRCGGDVPIFSVAVVPRRMRTR